MWVAEEFELDSDLFKYFIQCCHVSARACSAPCLLVLPCRVFFFFPLLSFTVCRNANVICCFGVFVTRTGVTLLCFSCSCYELMANVAVPLILFCIVSKSPALHAG